jgi:hypothetical protein
VYALAIKRLHGVALVTIGAYSPKA